MTVYHADRTRVASPSPGSLYPAPGSLSGPRQLVWVDPAGPQPAPVMLIGERPGEEESIQNAPFVGAAGRVLNGWMDRVSLSRSICRLTNTVLDYLLGNPEPLAWEVERDRPKLLADIATTHPRVIGAIGSYSAHWFLGSSAPDMETMHGVPFWWTHPTTGHRYPVVVIYHPAASFHTVKIGAMGQADLQVLTQVLFGQRSPVEDPYAGKEQYTEFHKRLLDLLAPRFPYLAVDTEGSFYRPWCYTASVRPGTAYMVRPDSPAMAQSPMMFDHFVRSGGVVLLHNSMHDLSVLRKLAIHLPPGSFIDTMIMAYLLNLEPKGLKPLARRHASMIMHDYDEILADANDLYALNYILQACELSSALPPTPPYQMRVRVTPKAPNKWTRVDHSLGTFVTKTKKPWSMAQYLARLQKDLQQGKSVDIRKRWNKMGDQTYKDTGIDIRESVVELLGPMPEATLDDVEYSTASHYANRDADATLRIFPVLRSMLDAYGMYSPGPPRYEGGPQVPSILQIDLGAIPMFERMQANGFNADVPHFRALGKRMKEEMGRWQDEIKALTGWEINPNSPVQVAALIYDHLELKPTGSKKATKTKKGKPSTQDKALESLRFSHPVMPPILNYRECSKIKSSFCDPLTFLTQRDNRIRTTIRTTNVESGRCSSSNPNLTAQPVRSELGLELRRGFVASPGCVLGTWDLDQIEMREMAHQSGDPTMIELLTRTDRDIHSETGAKVFGVQLNLKADNKKERYANVHPILHRYPAKRVGFGVITGITGLGLVDQMAIANATKNGLPLGQGGDPWTEDDCQRMILEWFKVYRYVEPYMESCRRELRIYGYVTDRWGRIRFLPGIYSEKRWEVQEAERQSHSHKISSSAQGVLKLAMSEIWKYNLELWREPGTHMVGDTVHPGRHVEPLIQVHDELVYEVEEDEYLMSYWDQVMVNCMCHTANRYDPMRVPVRAKGGWGPTWGDLEK